jgi:hypothetical protein
MPNNDVYFAFNGGKFNATPLKVKVANRELSVAGDTNCVLEIGVDFTRTDLLLKENNVEILQVDLVTPQLLLAAMNWVVTGEIDALYNLGVI